MNNQKSTTIVGGGLSGPLMALYMAKKGFNVTIFESRSDLRLSQVHEGRSINLALSTRGFTALQEVGVQTDALTIPMQGRLIHNLDGSTIFQKYGKDNQAIHSISRSLLNKVLLDHADALNITTHFNCRLQEYDAINNELTFSQNGDVLKHKCDLIIGADGYRSKIREGLEKVQDLHTTRVNESHGYKELTLSAGPNGQFQFEKNALHIWPRGSFMLIALPNQSGDFTCTLFLANEGDGESFANLKSDDQINAFFKQYFNDIHAIMPDLIQQFQTNPVGSLCTVKCENWNYQDKCILIGDAAHSLVPFYGQGMNCAFEDCSQFNKMISIDSPLEQTLQQFYTSRKPDCDAICDMAVENFKEMRDLVNDDFFKLKKQCESEIASKYPDFITKYGMVSFSTTPYDIARRRGQVIDTVLTQLCKEQFDCHIAYKMIVEQCAQLGI